MQWAKAATSIVGLDHILHGGVPRGKATVVVGAAGTGKTTLGLQFLANGARFFDEPGLMLSCEEDPETLKHGMTQFAACGPDALAVFFFDGRPPVGAQDGGNADISGLIAILSEYVNRHGIRRIVIDGLDTLFPGAMDSREYRRLLAFVASCGVTVLVLLKAAACNVEVAEYLFDAVIEIGSRVCDGFLRRILRVVKVRDASFAVDEHPFVISDRGLEFAYGGFLKSEPVLSDVRVSTGIERLDQMQEGGLLANTVTLISGLPGTAKSSMAASFLAANLNAGERGLLVALDEPALQLIRNVRSVGIDLDRHVASGRLTTVSFNAGAANVDEYYLAIQRAIDAGSPKFLVVDPVSALEKAGGRDAANMVAQRLSMLVKERGITAVFTAIANSHDGEIENTVGEVSMIADTWIHLSYAARGGERNRTLTIVKSRGTAHSNQMREVQLTRQGIVLEDVYQFEGEVLLGTARLSRRLRSDRERRGEEALVEKALRELEIRRLNAEARLNRAQLDLSAVDELVADVRSGSLLDIESALRDRAELVAERGGDALGVGDA